MVAPESLRVREAGAGDLETLVAMRLRLQEHLCRSNAQIWPIADGGAERRRTYRGWLGHPDARLVLLCEPGVAEPVGMAVGTVHTHPGFGPGRSGFVDDVWVEPAHRRRGGAVLLVRDLLDFFAARDLEHVGLGWAVGNREAEALWARLGFRPIIVTATASVAELRRSLAR